MNMAHKIQNDLWKKTLALFFLVICIPSHTNAEFDANLMESVRTWKKGQPLPMKLISFPEGKIAAPKSCALEDYGNNLSDYLQDSKNLDLFESLLFDPSADGNAVNAASSRIVDLKGIKHLAGIMEKQWKEHPMPNHPEICVLRQILMAPFVTLKVVQFAYTDLPQRKAQAALSKMEQDLTSGLTWEKTYKKFSNLYPDNSKKNSGTTLLRYNFAGNITSSGFVLESRTITNEVPKEALKEIFGAKKSTYIIDDGQNITLYFAEEYFEGIQP
jgi:hypothetical protein